MYRITYTSEAIKALAKMPKNVKEQVVRRLEQYAADPKSATSVIKLAGRSGYRMRVGGWRVLFEVKKQELLIIVIRIAVRGEAYK